MRRTVMSTRAPDRIGACVHGPKIEAELVRIGWVVSADPSVTSPTSLTRSKPLAHNLRVLEQSVDTATSAGRAYFGMLAVFAQLEPDVRRERQAEGIAKAKKLGVIRGAKPRIDRDQVLALINTGAGPAAAARALGVSRMSIYRIIGENTKSPDGNIGRK